MLKPLRSLTREVGRLARGEFEIGAIHRHPRRVPGALGGAAAAGAAARGRSFSPPVPPVSERAHVTVQSLVSYSQRLAALGRLTSGVAHEVKNRSTP